MFATPSHVLSYFSWRRFNMGFGWYDQNKGGIEIAQNYYEMRISVFNYDQRGHGWDTRGGYVFPKEGQFVWYELRVVSETEIKASRAASLFVF